MKPSILLLVLSLLLLPAACAERGDDAPPVDGSTAGGGSPDAGGGAPEAADDDVGGLEPATPAQPDPGFDGEVETEAPPATRGEDDVPEGFEDTVLDDDSVLEQGADDDLPPALREEGGDEPPRDVEVDSVRVHLVSAGSGDGGGGGEVIGCGDRMRAVEVPVEGRVAGPGEHAALALDALFGLADSAVPQGSQNALGRSRLRVQAVEAMPGQEGVFRVRLDGDLRLGGVCDGPRVRAQITGTALEVEGIDEVQVFVGSQPLDALLSERGTR